MSFKYFVLNILLCFLVFFLAVKDYETWRQPVELSPHEGIVPKESETKNENPPIMASTKEPMSLQPYIPISEKNIFSPERKDFPTPIVAPMMEAKKPVVRPQIVLYGLTIAEEYQSATVSNPGRPLGKDERETLTIKMGQKIGEYKLAKILPDRIAMESDGDTFEVLLYDPNHPKKKIEVKTETKPVMVSSTQPSPVPPPGEATKPTPSQEIVEKPNLPVPLQAQATRVPAQAVASLPYNKYTYQLLGPSAPISRGKIVDPASDPREQ